MVETTKAKQVSCAASSMLFPELDFDVTDNGTYPSEDSQRVLARIAFDNKFANAGAKAYQLARGDDVDVGAESRYQLARALLYHLRGLDADAVDDQFDRVPDAVLDEAARNRLFNDLSTLRSTYTTGSITATQRHRTSRGPIPTEELTVPTSSPPSVLSNRASNSRLAGWRWTVTRPTS